MGQALKLEASTCWVKTGPSSGDKCQSFLHLSHAGKVVKLAVVAWMLEAPAEVCIASDTRFGLSCDIRQRRNTVWSSAACDSTVASTSYSSPIRARATIAPSYAPVRACIRSDDETRASSPNHDCISGSRLTFNSSASVFERLGTKRQLSYGART